MAIRRLCYSELCMLGWPDYIRRVDGVWTLDEVAVNYLDCDMANSGADSQRLMPWTVWNPHPDGMLDCFTPYQLVMAPVLPPPGGPADADLGATWRFDLRLWNTWYWPIVRKVVQIAKSYGIKTWWCFGDSCQFHGTYRRWSPWVTNVNGVTTLWEDAAHAFFDAFVAKSLEELADLQVGWSFGNEMDPPHMRELTAKVIHPYIESGRILVDNCMYGAGMAKAEYVNGEYVAPLSTQDWLKADIGEKFGEKAKLAIWREVHGCGRSGWPDPPNRVDQALTWWGNNPIKIVLSDDGTWDGDSGCDYEPDTGRRRPSGKRWAEMIKAALGFKNSFIFELLPKGGSRACLKAKVKTAYKALWGKDPVEKWHYTPPPPPPPPPPPTVTVTVCQETGLLPREWCPVKEGRVFVVGQEPTTYCMKHQMPCSEFLKRWNILGWLRCIFQGKH